ncbi:unnamed protein product, partial [Phaeothamnion confervicola]
GDGRKIRSGTAGSCGGGSGEGGSGGGSGLLPWAPRANQVVLIDMSAVLPGDPGLCGKYILGDWHRWRRLMTGRSAAEYSGAAGDGASGLDLSMRGSIGTTGSGSDVAGTETTMLLDGPDGATGGGGGSGAGGSPSLARQKQIAFGGAFGAAPGASLVRSGSFFTLSGGTSASGQPNQQQRLGSIDRGGGGNRLASQRQWDSTPDFKVLRRSYVSRQRSIGGGGGGGGGSIGVGAANVGLGSINISFEGGGGGGGDGSAGTSVVGSPSRTPPRARIMRRGSRVCYSGGGNGGGCGGGSGGGGASQSTSQAASPRFVRPRSLPSAPPMLPPPGAAPYLSPPWPTASAAVAPSGAGGGGGSGIGGMMGASRYAQMRASAAAAAGAPSHHWALGSSRASPDNVLPPPTAFAGGAGIGGGNGSGSGGGSGIAGGFGVATGLGPLGGVPSEAQLLGSETSALGLISGHGADGGNSALSVAGARTAVGSGGAAGGRFDGMVTPLPPWSLDARAEDGGSTVPPLPSPPPPSAAFADTRGSLLGDSSECGAWDGSGGMVGASADTAVIGAGEGATGNGPSSSGGGFGAAGNGGGGGNGARGDGRVEFSVGDICRKNAAMALEAGQRSRDAVVMWALLAETVDGADDEALATRMQVSLRRAMPALPPPLPPPPSQLHPWHAGALGSRMVGRIIEHLERAGDVQTLATALCVLGTAATTAEDVSVAADGGGSGGGGGDGEDGGGGGGDGGNDSSGGGEVSLLPEGLGAPRYDRCLDSYAELLYAWGAHDTRVEVLKHRHAPQPQRQPGGWQPSHRCGGPRLRRACPA